MQDSIACEPVPRETGISSDEFVSRYKNTALPAVLSDATTNWPAREKWDIDYLSKTIGHLMVPVYSSEPAREKQHQHAAATNMVLSEYLQLLKNGEKDLRLFFYNFLPHAPELTNDFSYPNYGLKFFTKLPVLFMAGRGARVQMHFDIDLAHLFLCHFGGRKRVLLFPPEQTRFMYKVPFSFSSLFDVNFLHPDFEKYPALSKLQGYEAVLDHGDVLFIPSGYWHHVIYEDFGCSLTLRSFPTKLKQRLAVARNILITRSVEGLMRKVLGQKWNDFNEKRAVTISNNAI